MTHRVRAALAATALVAGGAACSYVSPDASEFSCVYQGGPFDAKGFEKAVPPGSGRTGINAFGSDVRVPVNVRQYDRSDGLPDITVTVRGVPLTFSPSLTFTISSVTTDPDGDGGQPARPAGCLLVEQHLRPLGATDFNDDVQNSAWVNEFLNVRVAPVVRDTAPRVLQDEDPTAIALNVDGARDAAAQSFGEELTKALAQQLGGEYFCAPTYRYGQSADACGSISVVLPEPGMTDDDRELIARPQRARTEANNEIAVARENARKAEEVASQLEIEAESAEQAATAREQIAEQQARVERANSQVEYAWCEHLAELGQDCALVKAAENSDYPDVMLNGSQDAVVAIPTEQP